MSGSTPCNEQDVKLMMGCLPASSSSRVARQISLPFLFALMLLLPGCPKGPGNAATGELEMSTLLKPFDPPTLEELNAKAEWEDQPVLDGLEEYRAFKAKHPPLVSMAEALKLRNDSAENNEKILTGLGQPYANESEMKQNATINRLIRGDINSTNGLLAQSTSDFDVIGMTGMGFFSFDWNLKPFASKDTVVSWQTSKDKLYDKVVIRKDLVWSDGRPITAHDVAFSFRVIMNPDVKIPAVRSGMETILGVVAYDDYTFVIFHKESLATNVWNCNFPIIPKHIYEVSLREDPTMVDSRRHQELEANPVVGGPYKVVKRVKGQEIILQRREDYYMYGGKQVRSKPNFEQVRFRVIEDSTTALLALNRGQVDDMTLQPQQWVEKTIDDSFYERNTKVRGEEWTFFFFGWNLKRPYFTDVRVRKAMSNAVNYDYILKTLCYDLYPQCSSDFHPGSWWGPIKPRTPYKQDLEQAARLLDEAGWKDTDGDGIRDKEINGRKTPFEFSIITSNDQLRIDICASLAGSLSQLGIVCHVQPVEFTVMQQRLQDHEFDANFGGWGTGTDPSTSSNIWKTGEDRNYGQYSNARVDELFELGRTELVQEKRAVYYREIDDILWEDQPYTWLYYRSGFYAFNKNLRGYMFSPRGPFHYSPGFDAVWPAAQ
ncbi:ABC transporter substrate-binding protein [Planctomicrobium sp. SH664]|uniref:ABC transporter substrate-binding protein n=1 Tax=Planctomicrobium sp. SH664 TaxID=3448125 RepID=UPI003F5C165A